MNLSNFNNKKLLIFILIVLMIFFSVMIYLNSHHLYLFFSSLHIQKKDIMLDILDFSTM